MSLDKVYVHIYSICTNLFTPYFSEYISRNFRVKWVTELFLLMSSRQI